MVLNVYHQFISLLVSGHLCIAKDDSEPKHCCEDTFLFALCNDMLLANDNSISTCSTNLNIIVVRVCLLHATLVLLLICKHCWLALYPCMHRYSAYIPTCFKAVEITLFKLLICCIVFYIHKSTK